MKFVISLCSFALVLGLMYPLDYPVFWKFVAAAIISLPVFFAFEHQNPMLDSSQLMQNSVNQPDNLHDYLPINEYNKRFGMSINDIKDQINSGKLNGVQVGSIWYIHKDELNSDS